MDVDETAGNGPSRRDRGPDDDVAQILVVCTGNVARSPLCMAMLEREAHRRFGPQAPVRVRSAGIHALAGKPAASESRRLARARGLDLERHRGALVEPGQIVDVDLVLTMTERQRAAVVQRAPAAAARTFTVRELARLVAGLRPLDDLPGPPRTRVRTVARLAHGARPYVARPSDAEDITDPYGRSPDAYDRMGATLDELVEVIAGQLFGPATGASGVG